VPPDTGCSISFEDANEITDVAETSGSSTAFTDSNPGTVMTPQQAERTAELLPKRNPDRIGALRVCQLRCGQDFLYTKASPSKAA
jgi:hypothetical protein